MADEKRSNVRVYEQKKPAGIPLWFWLLPLLALLGLGLWWFNRSKAQDGPVAAATPVTSTTDNLKPDSSSTGATAPLWTVTTIGDAFRKTGRVAFGDAEVHFATDSAQLQGDSQAVLDQVAQVFKDNPDWRMQIVGHTDSTGSASANEKLAGARAQSVAAYLAAHGVDRSRLHPIEERGQRQPKAPNATDTGRAENRRVELIKE